MIIVVYDPKNKNKSFLDSMSEKDYIVVVSVKDDNISKIIRRSQIIIFDLVEPNSSMKKKLMHALAMHKEIYVRYQGFVYDMEFFSDYNRTPLPKAFEEYALDLQISRFHKEALIEKYNYNIQVGRDNNSIPEDFDYILSRAPLYGIQVPQQRHQEINKWTCFGGGFKKAHYFKPGATLVDLLRIYDSVKFYIQAGILPDIEDTEYGRVTYYGNEELLEDIIYLEENFGSHGHHVPSKLRKQRISILK